MYKKNYYRKFHSEQKSIAECGVACLESVFKVHGFFPDKELLKKLTGTSSSGTTLLGLCEASNRLGLNADGYEGNLEELKKLKSPSILHVIINNNQLHFVVCYGFDGEHFILGDPGQGIHLTPPEELDKVWRTKRLLVFTGKVDEKKFYTLNTKNINHKNIGFRELIEEDLGLIITASVIGVAVAMLSLSLAYFSKVLLDDLLKATPDLPKLIIAITILLTTFIFKDTLSFVRDLMFLKQGKRLSNRMNKYFYRKLLHLPISYFQRMRTGDMISRMNDILKIQTVINYTLNNLVIDIFIYITMLLFIFTLVPWLAFIFVAFSIFFFLIAFFQTKKVTKAQKKVIESYGLNESTYINSLQGIEVIKAHNKEGLFGQLAIRMHETFQENLFRFGRYKNNLKLIYSMWGSLIIILTIFFTCRLYFQGELPVGSLVALLQVSLIVLAPVINISLANFKIQEAKIAFDRIDEFATIDPEYYVEKDKLKIKINRLESLKISQLTFKFPGTTKLIENINLEINSGEFVTIVGDSGAGKSTFLRILQKLYDIDDGQIFINNIEWNQISTYYWRELIGTVPQDIQLFNASIANNISLDNIFNASEIEEFCRTIGLDKFFKTFPEGYNTIIGETGISLSGGQRQLIGLARALYKKPQLLLLDEATSFLDNSTQEHIFELLKKISVNEDITVLYVTHDSKLAAYADKTIHIDKSLKLAI